MKFGEAITLLNAGHKLQREGWNGKGQWLYLIPASHWETTRGLEMLTGRPWIGIKTVDDQFMPWVASQSDMLADDWMIYVEPAGVERDDGIALATISHPVAKPVRKPRKAPYGLKKDGTPKAKPGRRAE